MFLTIISSRTFKPSRTFKLWNSYPASLQQNQSLLNCILLSFESSNQPAQISHTTMAEVIGVVSGVIGIFQFLQSLFPPDTNSADSSSLRIGVGLDGPVLSNAEGAVKTINLYNEDQTLVGTGKGDGDIASGSFQDITIDQSGSPGQQPTYVQINAGKHALCIAYITQKWPDGTQRGWLGDMGQECGASWAYSNIIVSDDGHKPAYTWLDQDHSNGINAAAVQIHMQDFTNLSSNPDTNSDYYCHLPAMIFEYNMDETGQPDSFWNSKRTIDKRQTTSHRDRIKPRSAAMASHIISSQDTSHSALKLCQSDTSYSPDFVSFAEGIFCDMDTKTPWPLCSATVTDDCYDWDTQTLVEGGTRKAKGYSSVENWQ